jgi:hypothetical protein
VPGHFVEREYHLRIPPHADHRIRRMVTTHSEAS